jgi:hypothetical protein
MTLVRKAAIFFLLLLFRNGRALYFMVVELNLGNAKTVKVGEPATIFVSDSG